MEPHGAEAPLRAWLYLNDGPVIAAMLLLWLGLVAWQWRALTRSFQSVPRRIRQGLLLCAVAGALLSTLWIPSLDRFEPLGHEASYYEAFTARSLEDPSKEVRPGNSQGWEGYVTYPLIRWTYWVVGGLSGRPDSATPLLWLKASVRGLSVLLLGWVAFVLTRRGSSALVSALLMLLHPWHSFWAASIYNVTIPYFFVTATLLLALLAWRSGSSRMLLAAAVSGCLVVAGRVEWGILAPCLLFLLLSLGTAWGRHARVYSIRFWAPGVAVALLLGFILFQSGGQLTEQGGYHGLGGYLATMLRQIQVVGLLEPFHTPWAALLILAGGALAARQLPGGRGLALGLLVFFVFGQVCLLVFNDFSFRHGLLPGTALVLLGGLAATGLTLADRRIQGLVALLLLAQVATSLMGVERIASRYYLSQEEFSREHPGFRGDMVTTESLESGSCYLISDTQRYWDREIAGSAFNLMDPAEAATHYRTFGGCVLWVYDYLAYRYDGLAVPPRALKLRTWFDWKLAGWARTEEGMVLVYWMTSPPWGITEEMALPETEFRLSDEQ